MESNFKQLDSLVVHRRLPHEATDIREFIRPDDVAVRELYAILCPNGASDTDKVLALYEWVCENIRYPKGKPWSVAFNGYRAKVEDYWLYPGEVLATRTGDCDTTSHLLASLIRNFAPPGEVHVVLGGYKNCELTHAWVEWRNLILETTKDKLTYTYKLGDDYCPLMRYNDRNIFVKEGNTEFLFLSEAEPFIAEGQEGVLEIEMAELVPETILDMVERSILDYKVVLTSKVEQDGNNRIHIRFRKGLPPLWVIGIVSTAFLVPVGVLAWKLYTRPAETLRGIAPYVLVIGGIGLGAFAIYKALT